jgi:hypothetical protein
MKPEEQRIAIADAAGFIAGYSWSRSDGIAVLPDYLNDLNAMHEAEKVIGPIKGIEFCYHLNEMGMSGEWEILTATAAQRAEAFLKTIGQWNN